MEQQQKDIKTILRNLIGGYEMRMSESLRRMEYFNITKEEYHEAALNLNIASFTLSYLYRAMSIAEGADDKTIENFIRLHKYQLETKASGESDVIKLVQDDTISCLCHIIDNCFDK